MKNKFNRIFFQTLQMFMKLNRNLDLEIMKKMFCKWQLVYYSVFIEIDSFSNFST